MSQLRLIVVKKESSTLGLKVRALVNSLLECESLHTFQGNFKEEVKKIRTGNDKRTEHLYKAELKDEFTNNETVHITKDHIEKGAQVIMILRK